MKLCLSLSLILLNHFITDDVFFHWLIFVATTTFLLILSRICLVILPISDLVGLISLQVGLFAKGRFMIFQGYKCFLLGRDIYPVVDAKFYCDFLILLLDLLRCVVVSFLVRFCDVLLEEFVVLLWF